MLYAQWCLDDLERVDEIMERSRDISGRMQIPFSQAGADNLNRAHSQLIADMRNPPRMKVKATPEQIEAAAQHAFAALRDAVLADPNRLT